MGLRGKFNLVLITVFLIGYAGSIWFAHQMLQKNAKDEVLHNASLIMEAALAIRHYTVKEIRPLLKEKSAEVFLPQTVPAYAATQNVERMRINYPEYSYKEAAMNPTNPRNRATDWETDIIKYFAEHKDEKTLEGIRQTPTGLSLFISRPIQIINPACLSCHSEPEKAPKTLIDKYGDSNGFGWKQDEFVGAQIVSVPMSTPLERAELTLIWFASILGGVFMALLVVSNIILQYVVIRPVKAMAESAQLISTGAMETPEINITGKDEIATLAQSFNRMHRSLGNAMKQLQQRQ